MKQLNKSKSADPEYQARAEWIGILARARPEEIEAAWASLGEEITFDWLRKPHTGLVMLRARAGGTGNPFNLGEMTLTRCALRLSDGTVGYAYVQGRDRRHAEIAARFDGLLQQDGWRAHLLTSVIGPLRAKQEERRVVRSRKAASTKVNFFTMVRGEDPE